MSQRPDKNDPTAYDTGDSGERTTRRHAPGHLNVGSTSGQTIGGPVIGGEPAMPGTAEHEHERMHNKGKSPMGISTGLLWSTAIFFAIAVAIIVYFFVL